MSENDFKRLCLEIDEDDNDDCIFSDSEDEWQCSFNRKKQKRQRIVARAFFERKDEFGRPISPTLNAAATKYDLRENEPRRLSAKVLEMNEELLKVKSSSFGFKKPEILEREWQKKKSKKFAALKDIGRWKPADDLLLIISVLQVNDLDIVSAAAKFSCKFTLEEIQIRWHALLYDELISRTASAAIRKMHPEQQLAVHRRAPFSLVEENLLCDIPSSNDPSLDDFQIVLQENIGNFYHARTTKALQKHWRLLKKYELLCDQHPQENSCAAGPMPLEFSDAEAELEKQPLEEPFLNMHIKQELKLMDQQIKRRTRLLEDELGHWMQLLGIPVKGMQLYPNFDSKTFAILYGRRLRYGMRSRLISFGRLAGNEDEIDVDLSIEGPSHKISRYQGVIELRDDGIFCTRNFGKRPFFVNGKPLMPERMMVLRYNSLFEIFGLSFVFLINKDLVEEVCFNEPIKAEFS